MRLVWGLRVAGVAVVLSGLAVVVFLRAGVGAGPFVLVMQVLALVVPGLTVLGLAEVLRLQLRTRELLATHGPARPSPALPPAPGNTQHRPWLVWALRGLAGVLLAGLVLDVATAVSQGFVLMIAVLTTASYLGLSAQMAAVAELLRLQAILRDAMQARSQADQESPLQP